MNANELISQAVELPHEERARVVDSLLKSLNQLHAEVDNSWAELARQRLAEIRDGRVQGVPGDKVFEKLRARFEK